MTKSILVLGGTGATGRHVVSQLLEKGHNVRSIVRSKERLIALLPEELRDNDNLTIIESTVLSMSNDELVKVITGCQVVICCLGHNGTLEGVYGEPRMLVKDSIAKISDIVKDTNPPKAIKIILMGTIGAANPDGSDELIRPFGERMLLGVLRIMIPPVKDNEAAAEYLSKTIGKEESSLEWVVVRPDDLIDGEVSDYQITPKPSGSLFGAGKTTRSNVAAFMCDLSLNDSLWKEWVYKMPVIRNVLNDV